MSRFNKRQVVSARTATGPIQTVSTPPTVRTAEGGQGFLRDAKSEVFLLATTSLDITARTFYEGGDARVERFKNLIRTVAVDDPDWTFEFLRWLRGPGNIRTASIVGAVEASLAMVHDGITGSRAIIDSVCQRPDEPGELLAYLRQTYGRRIPKPIKRGLADAAIRLYSERSLLKYDTASHAVRFADVIELTRPAPVGRQSALFKYAIDRRHGRTPVPPDGLTVLTTNYALGAEVAEGHYESLLSPSTLYMAGMTWEDSLSLAGSNVDKADLWRALIPSMGYMALLRNLRNFDEAGLSDADVKPVIEKLTNPEEVKLSRQLPLRFLSAYRAVSNLRWAYPLETALSLSLSNVPQLPGRTLILVDTSQSMNDRMSDPSGLLRWDAAVAFGLALANRCEQVDVYSFSWSPNASRSFRYGGPTTPPSMSGDNPTMAFPVRAGESLLKGISRWQEGGFFINGGTDTVGALRHTLRPDHDRVVLLTDEQAGAPRRGAVGDVVPPKTPLYTFNLAGYKVAHTESTPTRVTLGGLSDQMFGLIPVIEGRKDGRWTWETTSQS